MEKIFFIFLEIFLKCACRKLIAMLEQKFKVNVDQHASKIMWFYGLRKKFFGRCLTLHIELYQYGLTSSLLRSPLHGSSHNIGTDQNMYLHREMKQHLMDFEVFFYCLRVILTLKLKKGINSKIIKT